MKLRCPIPRQFRRNGKKCLITQLFGENKDSSFYGPKGHRGVDFKTMGSFEYEQINTWDWTDGPIPEIKEGEHGFKRSQRDLWEQKGRIPLLASMDGDIQYYLNKDRENKGWGLTITNGDWRTLYWHIETPWDGITGYDGKRVTVITDHKATAGEPIAIAGNNGKSTGPHLHFELQEKTENGWKEVNPMPYFDDWAVVYETTDPKNKKYFYRGEEINKSKSRDLLSRLPSVKTT